MSTLPQLLKLTERLTEIMAFENHCFETNGWDGWDGLHLEKNEILESLGRLKHNGLSGSEEDRLQCLATLQQLNSVATKVEESSRMALTANQGVTKLMVRAIRNQGSDLSPYGNRGVFINTSKPTNQGSIGITPTSILMDQRC